LASSSNFGPDERWDLAGALTIAADIFESSEYVGLRE
jgi:hypothetical protein